MDAPRTTVRRARALRKTMTAPEILLWSVLRGSEQAGLRFRRQHPIGPYILDFCCFSARLAVEIDSELHALGGQPVHDQRRDRWMADQGILTLRVQARDVTGNLEGVVQAIVMAASERRTTRPSSPLGGSTAEGRDGGDAQGTLAASPPSPASPVLPPEGEDDQLEFPDL